ncbi:MAG: glycosyltransferase family 2 protein [Gammaproteobacteria bacterium]|nr:glycosyltransferase family 2 protein [Gammaproteobacteria bacterium]
MNKLSIVIPARNESSGLSMLLPNLREAFPQEEIIIVNDGSTDNTADTAEQYGAKVINHPYSMGNGAAIKTGARAATGDTIAFLDADGQHAAADLEQLLRKHQDGYDMVVGARKWSGQASMHRGLANEFYNRFASWMVGAPIPDLTSGMRIVDARKFREFLSLLPNGFSYPTTITMAFFRAGYTIRYFPIHVSKREGKSHIRLFRDGLRFLLIIMKVGTLYSPLKLFTPISFFFFSLASLHYLNTYVDGNRFTNMSALLYVTSVLVFLIGLVSEQITNLLFLHSAQTQQIRREQQDTRNQNLGSNE